MPDIKADFENLSEEEIRKLLIQMDALASKQGTVEKIETDDELHAWIKQNLGLDIPRVAVCPHHNAPFEFLADLFFERVDAALVMANRGGGKSYLAALWNVLNSYWKEGAECLHVGAIEIQAKRVYAHVKQFQAKAAPDKVADTNISQTLWSNGSKIEIVTGSLSSVNGPHSQKVHRDEIELMDRNVYQESLQIERAKTIDGKTISSQTLLTSTRKTSDGLMQELLDECAEAERENRRAPFKVYQFCIKECMQNQPTCRVAFPDLPEAQKCDCQEWQSGEWEEGQPRTFDQICGGAFAKSEGFVPLVDGQKTFSKSSKAMWEAQQECKRPYVEDLTLPEFSRERHGIRNFVLDPENGPIFTGIDFGGTNPHAVEWFQVLDYEVEVESFSGLPKRLPEGTRVLFDELYIAEIGNTKLADLIVEVEREYRRLNPKFRVAARFADPQAKAARLDFKAHDPPLICSWPAVTRDREEHVKRTRDLLVDNLFAVNLDKVEMFVEEVEAWNIKNKKFDHAIDATNYGLSNIYILEKRRERETISLPSVSKKRRFSVFESNPNPFDDNIPGASKSPHRTYRPKDKWD